MKPVPRSVSVAHMLILLDAAFWLAYAVLSALGEMGAFPAESVIRWVMVVLALGCAAVLVGAVIFLRRRRRAAFYGAVLLLALLAVLSITDEFGVLDLVSLLLSLAPLGLLLKDRAWYLGAERAPSAGQPGQ